MQRLHEPQDTEKLDRLTTSIDANGWQGAPLVVADGLLITGMHRSEAWELAGEMGDPPTIDIRELVADYDDKLASLMQRLDWYDALVRIVDGMPAETVAKYGIDLH